MACNATNYFDAVVQIVAAAENHEIKSSVVLQRTAYLLEVAEVGYGFKFGHKFCSPWCEEVERGARGAGNMGDLEVKQFVTDWGVTKTTYKTLIPYQGTGAEDDVYHFIVNKAIACKQIQLDLVATAAYYQNVKINNPWKEIEDLKSYDRKNGTFEKSQELYEELQSLPAFKLPEIPVPTKLAA